MNAHNKSRPGAGLAADRKRFVETRDCNDRASRETAALWLVCGIASEDLAEASSVELSAYMTRMERALRKHRSGRSPHDAARLLAVRDVIGRLKNRSA